jgi:hypothetical protein
VAESPEGFANTSPLPPTYDTSIISTGLSSLTPDSSETQFSALTSCDLMEPKESQSVIAMWEEIQSMKPAQKNKALREAKIPSGLWLWRLLFMKTH